MVPWTAAEKEAKTLAAAPSAEAEEAAAQQLQELLA
jgi:hypothetical protein